MDYTRNKVHKTLFAKITNAIPLLNQNQAAWLDTTSKHYKNGHDFNTLSDTNLYTIHNQSNKNNYKSYKAR